MKFNLFLLMYIKIILGKNGVQKNTLQLLKNRDFEWDTRNR